MRAKDKLAQALEEIGLGAMATRARAGYYDDFLSPLATPIMQLAADLASCRSPEANALRKRVINGDFDASADEAGQ